MPPRAVSPNLQCYECGKLFMSTANVADLYILDMAGVCPACSAKLDWWKLAYRMVERNFMLTDAFQILGAKQTIFTTKVYLNTITLFDLYQEGLPANAKILDVNLSPEHMFCTELNTNVRRMRNKGGELQLLGFQTDTDLQTPDEGIVHIFVTWVETSVDDAAWTNLVLAFDYYADKNYETSLVPANVTVEYRLFQFVEQQFANITSQQRVKDFLESAATYSHQLNILLPFIARQLNAPVMPTDLRGRLNRLRDLRNLVAHHGRCNPPLTNADGAELVTAALFGFRYLGILAARAAECQT